MVFTRQFGTMINAGLPLVQCLEILSTQSENKVLRETVGEVRGQVEGSTFSDALRRHPKVFDDLYVNMVHAGEVGGLLDTILTRLAKHIEKAMKLKGQIKSAMIYPSAILGVAGIVITVLMIFVIPIFAKMFEELSNGKVGLPGPTQLVIDISNAFQSFWYIGVGLIVGAVTLVKKYYATPKGRMAIDRFLLKTPIFGDLIRKASVAKFTRTLGTLLSSGVPLLDGLIICQNLRQQSHRGSAVERARQHQRRQDDCGSVDPESGVPQDGHAHDCRGRIHGRTRCHARKNRRFLRR